jgi:hypothetical protein
LYQAFAGIDCPSLIRDNIVKDGRHIEKILLTAIRMVKSFHHAVCNFSQLPVIPAKAGMTEKSCTSRFHHKQLFVSSVIYEPDQRAQVSGGFEESVPAVFFAADPFGNHLSVSGRSPDFLSKAADFPAERKELQSSPFFG